MTTLLKDTFQKGVSIVNRFVSLRPSIPVLGNIFFSAEKGKVILRVTNLETSIEIVLSAKTDKEFETTIPAKLLTEFLNTVRGKEVTIEAEKENIILSTTDTKGTIATISATEFPKPPFLETKKDLAKFETNSIFQNATKVAFAASQDEGKPVLNSIYLKKEDDKLALVATDGFRLAKQLLTEKTEVDEILVPARTFVESLKVAAELEEAEVGITSDKNTNQLLIIGENFQVATRLISGVYPNYKQIIPNNFPTNISISREELLAAVKTAAVFARDLGNVVTLTVDKKNTVTLSATTLQIGGGTTRVDAQAGGEELKISFNSHYFLDGLAALKSETITVDFSGALSPALMTGKDEPNFTYIVMPVKSQK